MPQMARTRMNEAAHSGARRSIGCIGLRRDILVDPVLAIDEDLSIACCSIGPNLQRAPGSELLRRLGHEFVMRHREFGSINHILIENGIGFISSRPGTATGLNGTRLASTSGRALFTCC